MAELLMFLSVFGAVLLVVTPFILLRWGIYRWKRWRLIKDEEKLRKQARRELEKEEEWRW